MKLILKFFSRVFHGDAVILLLYDVAILLFYDIVILLLYGFVEDTW